MKDNQKTKARLICELDELRQRLLLLESIELQKERQSIKPSGGEERYTLLEEEFSKQYLTLREIIDSTSAIIFSVDNHYCYTNFNKKHALVMKSIYGKEIEIGQNILDYMSVEEDRNNAKYNLDRALRGEQFLESAYSGQEGLSRLYFEVSHNPIRSMDGTIIGVVVVSNDVTDRKRTEDEIKENRVNLEKLVIQRTEQLKTTEALYHNLFEHMNTVILIVDPQTTAIVDANPAACKFYGYSYDDLIKLNVTDINILTQAQIKNEMERARLQEKAYFNMRHRLADGEIREVEIYSDPINMGGKQLLLSVIHDNTERKRAEDQLQILSRAIEQSPASIVITDIYGTIEYVNPKFTELTGYTLQEAVGNNPRILKTGFTPVDDYKKLWQTITSGVTWRGEFCNHKKDGEFYWERASISPVMNETGIITHFVAVKEDITAQKKVEEELFRSRQMLELAMDNIPILFFWKDRNFIFQGCNNACAAQAGLSHPSEIIGKTDFDLPWKELAEHYRADDQFVMQTDSPKLGFEELIPQLDGTQIWVRTNKVPLHDQNGNVIGLFASSEDITEHKQAEQEIEKANEQLIAWVNNLEQRSKEANLLRQMGDLLQACEQFDEYYAIIKEFIHLIIPNTTGALLIINNSRTSVETMVIWGEGLQSEICFAPEECWALRRGKIHVVKSSSPGLKCQHMEKTYDGCYLDVPMVASGETIGIIHIESPREDSFLNGLQDLALTLTENLSLSFSNLKLRQTLRSQSIRDVLTGLFNRRYMEETLSRELPRAARKKTQIGFIMLDVDHFKKFNDTYGHDAGDLVLHELGALLQANIRKGDIACRFGGEEFILILPEADLEVTVQRAELIREKINEISLNLHHQPLSKITVSLGVAIFPEHGITSDVLIKKADEALYQAKHNGRNRVEAARLD
jgi:diguanylate cyclase (GGDEF)-like protein/PAS domain S-box-containing protein